MIQDALGWCTGMTLRGGMGREGGGGSRMGNTWTPVVDSCHCMAKPIQYFKVISLQLNKFIFKKDYTTQRDGMGREEGGGFRMGNTCIPVVDSF